MSFNPQIRAALHLNNAGVALLRRGYVLKAIQVLEHALRALRNDAGGHFCPHLEQQMREANQAVALAHQCPISCRIQTVCMEELVLGKVFTEDPVILTIDTPSEEDDMDLEIAMVLFNFGTTLKLCNKHHQAFHVLKLVYCVLHRHYSVHESCPGEETLCLMHRTLSDLVGLATELNYVADQLHFYEQIRRLPHATWLDCGKVAHAGAA